MQITSVNQLPNLAIKVLAKALKKADIDPSNWFEDCYEVNNALYEAGIKNISLQHYCTQDSGFVQVLFYSTKIHEMIVTEGEMSLEFDSLNDMAESLCDYSAYATRLENLLPELDYNL